MPTEQEKLLAKQMSSQGSQDALRSRMGIDRLKEGFTYLERTSAQSIPNAANQTIGWNSEVEDRLGWFDPADEGFIVPTQEMWIEIIFAGAWNFNASNTRNLSIYKNSSKYYEEVFPATGQDPYGRGSITVVMHVTPPDYLEAIVYQDSGGALNFGSPGAGVQTPFLYIKKVG